MCVGAGVMCVCGWVVFSERCPRNQMAWHPVCKKAFCHALRAPNVQDKRSAAQERHIERSAEPGGMSVSKSGAAGFKVCSAYRSRPTTRRLSRLAMCPCHCACPCGPSLARSGAKEPSDTTLPAYLANCTLPSVQACRCDVVCVGGRCSKATRTA